MGSKANKPTSSTKERAEKKLLRRAKRDLVPEIDRLLCLGSAQSCFQSSVETGKEFLEHFDEIKVWGRHAHTRTMIVDYSKPWSGNNARYLKNFAEHDHFLEELKASGVHDQILAFRSKVAAHVDGGMQPVALVVVGSRAKNERHRENRFDEVVVPFKVRVEQNTALGFDSQDGVRKILEPSSKVLDAVNAEIADQAAKVLRLLTGYMPVLHLLDNVSIEEVADGFDAPDISQGGVHVTREKDLPIDDVVFKRVLGRFESKAKTDIDHSSPGLAVTTKEDGEGRLRFTVSFRDIELDRM